MAVAKSGPFRRVATFPGGRVEYHGGADRGAMAPGFYTCLDLPLGDHGEVWLDLAVRVSPTGAVSRFYADAFTVGVDA